MEKMRKQIIIKFLLIAILLVSCDQRSKAMKDLTDNSCKFWHLNYFVRVKENIKEEKNFQVLQFCFNHKLIEYRYVKNRLKKVSYTCYIPPQKWKFESNSQIVLNDKLFVILKLNNKSLVLFDKGRNLKLYYFKCNHRP
jgi:hypothetical protein